MEKVLQISEINTKEQFYEMKNYWDETLNRSTENNIFLTWEKMAPSVNYMEAKSSLKILCATEGNELVGIAPFRITHRRLKGLLSYDIIEPLAYGETDYTGIIITKQEEQCLHQFIVHLLSQKDWDFMNFPDLPQTAQTLALMRTAKDIPKFEAIKGAICPYIAIPGTKDKLLANLNSKFQKKLRNSLHKLESEQGKVELRNYYELGSLDKTMEIFVKLHQKRWTARGEPGRFSNQKSLELTKQTARYFAEKDWLRLYFLTVNNKPVAAELNLEYKEKMYCHLKGLDPDYYKYRVGSLLTFKVLEECVKKRISEYDFMQGDEAYKFDWTNKFRQNMNIQLVNTKLSSSIIKASLKVFEKTKIDSILIKYIKILSIKKQQYNEL